MCPYFIPFVNICTVSCFDIYLGFRGFYSVVLFCFLMREYLERFVSPLPPKFLGGNRAFGVIIIDCEGSALMNGIRSLIKEARDPTELSSSFCHVRRQCKVMTWNGGVT